MCKNPAAIHIIEANLDKIDMFWLSSNPAAIHLLEKDKINWCWLSYNPAAIDLLEQNQDKIDWDAISENPAIFVYDYERMVRPFTEELIATVYHPDNFKKLM